MGLSSGVIMREIAICCEAPAEELRVSDLVVLLSPMICITRLTWRAGVKRVIPRRAIVKCGQKQELSTVVVRRVIAKRATRSNLILK
jgi:hypothetical protein